MTSITVGDGKYTVSHDNGCDLVASRNGEPWRELAGDKLILALVQEIETLREALKAAVDTFNYASMTSYERDVCKHEMKLAEKVLETFTIGPNVTK